MAVIPISMKGAADRSLAVLAQAVHEDSDGARQMA
jgi:hypothetical protein